MELPEQRTIILLATPLQTGGVTLALQPGIILVPPQQSVALPPQLGVDVNAGVQLRQQEISPLPPTSNEIDERRRRGAERQRRFRERKAKRKQDLLDLRKRLHRESQVEHREKDSEQKETPVKPKRKRAVVKRKGAKPKDSQRASFTEQPNRNDEIKEKKQPKTQINEESGNSSSHMCEEQDAELDAKLDLSWLEQEGPEVCDMTTSQEHENETKHEWKKRQNNEREKRFGKNRLNKKQEKRIRVQMKRELQEKRQRDQEAKWKVEIEIAEMELRRSIETGRRKRTAALQASLKVQNERKLQQRLQAQIQVMQTKVVEANFIYAHNMMDLNWRLEANAQQLQCMKTLTITLLVKRRRLQRIAARINELMLQLVQLVNETIGT